MTFNVHDELVLADEQPVLITSTGRRAHLPHHSGGRPACSTTASSWTEKALQQVHSTHPLCDQCVGVAVATPHVAALDPVTDTNVPFAPSPAEE